MKNKPQAHIKKFSEHAVNLVKHYFGTAPTSLAPLGGGLTNFVYSFSMGKEEFVVRLSDNSASLAGFMKEQWAVSHAQRAGVPVPEILEVGQDIVSFPYMIQRKVSGSDATGETDCKDILREMGHYTAIIHSIRTRGYGPVFDWSKNTLSKSNTWPSYLKNELQLPQRIAVLAKHNMLPTTVLSRLRKELKTLEGLNKKPALQHGDMRLKNVMVNDKGKIVSIIDWENAVSSIPPYWDLSIALHDLNIDDKLYFLEGYGITQRAFRSIAPAIKAINLVNYAPVVERIVARKDKERLEQYRTRLQGALDLFML